MPFELLHIFRNTPFGRETLMQSVFFCQQMDMPIDIYVPRESQFLMYFEHGVVTVDLETGDAVVLLNLTELLRRLAREGWSNNVEGIAIGGDGSLWLVADNAVTGVIDNPLPPPGESRTLLLRVPPTKSR